jgi:hypothetical protein
MLFWALLASGQINMRSIAIATVSLIALMFWLGMGATGKDAAVVNAPLKPEYAFTSDPYLPVRRLEPAY